MRLASILIIVTIVITTILLEKPLEQQNQSVDINSLPKITFVKKLSTDEKKSIENIVSKKLSLIGATIEQFVWKEAILYYKPFPYKESSFLKKYIEPTGKIIFKKVKPPDYIFSDILTDIELLNVELTEEFGEEPNIRKISFKFRGAEKYEEIACYIDSMLIRTIKTSFSNEASAVIHDSLGKLLHICSSSGAFPVETETKNTISEYVNFSEAFFSIPPSLTEELLKLKKNFLIKPSDNFPIVSDYDSAVKNGLLDIPNTRGYVEDLDIEGKKRSAVVVEGAINLTSGYIEAAISSGAKLHECLINCYASLQPLDLAITLLGIKRDDRKSLDSRAVIFIQWEKTTYRLEDLIIDVRDKRTMQKVGWYYPYSVCKKIDPLTNTEHEVPKSFATRLIATTVKIEPSMFENPLPDQITYDQSRYIVNSFLVPPASTKIKIIITKSDESLIKNE